MKKRRKHRKVRARARARLFEYLFAMLMAAFMIFIIFSAIFPSSPTQKTQSNVAIIDQLSIRTPNQTFLDNVVETFSSVDLEVDIFSGEEVTVEFYKSLPSLGYGIIVFRVHSAYPLENPELIPIEDPRWPVYLFTGESYDEGKYVIEQLTDKVSPAKVTENSPSYFAVGPDFVRDSMDGRFPNTLIILSTCGGLYSFDLAEAFIEKGAVGIISWSDLVDPGHTDSTIDFLIRSIFLEKLDIESAVKKTMEEVGPDPYYESFLLYYPEEVGKKTLSELVLASLPNQSIRIFRFMELEKISRKT